MKGMTKQKFEDLEKVTLAAIKSYGKLLYRTGYGDREADFVVRNATVVADPSTGKEHIIIFHPHQPGATNIEDINTTLFRLVPTEPERLTRYLNVYPYGAIAEHKTRDKADEEKVENREGAAVELHLVKGEDGNWTVDKEA